MADYDFSKVDAYILEPESGARRLIRNSLEVLSVTRIASFSGLNDLREGIAKETPDLLICDIESADSDLLRLIHSTRHGHLGTNPYLCVIVTTWAATKPLVDRFTNCGADALLIKPFSIRQLADRVIALTDAPRHFIVTNDYIGPDRRRAPREGVSSAPLVEVPHSLRLKATRTFSKTDLPALIDNADREINERKLVRHAFQIAFLLEFALPDLLAGRQDGLAWDHLLRAITVLDETQRRFTRVNRTLPQAEATCGALKGLAQRVKDGKASATDLAQLRPRSIELMRMISPHRRAEELAREVSDAVAGYRRRLEELAKAKQAG
ncbi:MAG: response regulator [Azospirillaceae bacterium]|nr:response regulator [Azospirillaceae bacterium]